ncbi:XRE family transcriptional regulator [Enterococcus asini]|uniref:XRE family transcriptional regulator n=1 Tax=Enterococcus asini TaxID=57732 RepID=UPI00289148E7|nr:XRE family transcriptional regulator [Enterococcus asini]MDT2743924.1 XRE family transcriptional regulator [Enterococcus asini]
MFEISEEMVMKLREKRGRQRSTILEASKEIGISRITLGSIESKRQKKASKTVYEKLVNWLFSPDEMGG